MGVFSHVASLVGICEGIRNSGCLFICRNVVNKYLLLMELIINLLMYVNDYIAEMDRGWIC